MEGEDERGAMGGRRSRPLGAVGNIHWKENLVYRFCLTQVQTFQLFLMEPKDSIAKPANPLYLYCTLGNSVNHDPTFNAAI